MAHVKVDRVQQTTQSTGAGALVLDPAAIPRMFRFQDKMENGSQFWGLIEHGSADEVEISYCTYNAGSITRSFALGSSSSTGGLVPFSAGVKTVSVVAPAGATPIVDGDGNMSVPGGLTVVGAVVAGDNSLRMHTFKSDNDTQLLMYSDTAAEFVIEAMAVSNPAVKYTLRFNKFGGSTTFGGDVTAVGNVTAKSLIVGGGLNFVPGAFTADSNWGMMSIALTASPLNAEFGWFNAAGATRKKIDTNGHWLPGADNTQNIGNGSFRIGVVFAGTGTINTSDANDKDNFRPAVAAEVRVGRRLGKLIEFWQYKDALAEKGPDGARWHVGLVAQVVVAIFNDEGLNPFRYGCVGFDLLVKDEVYTEEGSEPRLRSVPDLDDNGVQKQRLNVRPDQLMAFIARAQAEWLEELETRIAAIETP